MKINKYLLLIAIVLISVSLLAGVLAYFGNEKEAQAQSVVSYQTIALEDGTDQYLMTTYSDGVLVGYYGVVQIQAVGVMTYTDAMTITPQFSNQPVGCTSVTSPTGWFDAETYVPYVNQSRVVIASGWETVSVTSTVTSGVMTYSVLTHTFSVPVTTTVAKGREVPVLGRCFRVRMEGPPIFTPTVFIRLVNRQ